MDKLLKLLFKKVSMIIFFFMVLPNKVEREVKQRPESSLNLIWLVYSQDLSMLACTTLSNLKRKVAAQFECDLSMLIYPHEIEMPRNVEPNKNWKCRILEV